LKIIIAGGGTAGHINPGLAIAEIIKQKEPNSEILFVGTKGGLETKLVPRAGFNLEFIRVKGFVRKISFGTLASIKELALGLKDAAKVVKKFQPDVVVGTGGYVCGPVVFRAYMARIPCIIHEQNVYPGVTNKMLSRFAKVTALSFEESKMYFKHAKKTVFTGNPVKNEIIYADREKSKQMVERKFKIDLAKKTVVIFGGSRGSKTLNSVVEEMLNKYEVSKNFNVIFATGEALYSEIINKLEIKEDNQLNIVPYIYNMSDVLCTADLVISRSGAITVSELATLGIPSILIPSPYVVANHQEYNARNLEKHNAALVILEKELTADILYEKVTTLISNKGELEKMSANAKKLAKIDASSKIYEICKTFCK